MAAGKHYDIHEHSQDMLTSEQPGGEVSSRVDSVAAVESETNPNTKHGQANKEWDQLLADLIKYWRIILILSYSTITSTCMFLLSVMAHTHSRSRAVPRTWSPTPPW